MNRGCRIFGIILLSLLVGSAGGAHAQNMPAVPAPAVQAETKAPEGKGTVFIELFSAERCPFCPQAERNMNDILTDPEVLGFTCMVDYFDAGLQGALSRPFCTDQQDLYIGMLKSGSRYTPQMVINGRVQLPGYDFQKTAAAIRNQRAEAAPVLPLIVQKSDRDGVYDIVLPQLAEAAADDQQKDPYVLRLIVLQNAPRLARSEEHRQVREKMPSNIAIAILDAGFWDGRRTVWTAKPPLDLGGDAFIALAQDRRSGAILAAGRSGLSLSETHKTD